MENYINNFLALPLSILTLKVIQFLVPNYLLYFYFKISFNKMKITNSLSPRWREESELVSILKLPSLQFYQDLTIELMFVLHL